MQKSVPSTSKPERIDPKFKHEISQMHGAEKIMLCVQCGTCTADCSVSRFIRLYEPRTIARKVQLGLKDRLLSDEALWLCTTCFTCVDRCPQGVEVSSIVRGLRNLSVKEKGILPLVYKGFATNILKTGSVYVIPESRNKKRQEEGLPPLPRPSPEHLAKIFEATGCSKRLQNMKTS